MSTDPRAFSLGHGWLHPHMEGVKQWGGLSFSFFLFVCLMYVCVQVYTFMCLPVEARVQCLVRFSVTSSLFFETRSLLKHGAHQQAGLAGQHWDLGCTHCMLGFSVDPEVQLQSLCLISDLPTEPAPQFLSVLSSFCHWLCRPDLS